MAKTAPLKKKGQSIHSRAAKRASSPSIDTDKSLKVINPPIESSNRRPSILAIHQGAGVTKKSKNGRKSILSSKAKRRQEKGLDRAEAVMDKKERRIEKSKGKSKTIQERSRAWDELNRKMAAKKAREAALALEKENWVDERNGEEAEEIELDHAVVELVRDLDVKDLPSVNSSDFVGNVKPAKEDEEIL